MKSYEVDRLIDLDKRIREIAEEEGLLTTDIDFEIVPARKMLEAMAYHFPTNFSHWSFGRDFEAQRTIYEHSGQGIPYECVWNFNRPRAFLVETNPFALNVLVVAHVYGHVDFFLANKLLKKGRSFSDIADEARVATERFRRYRIEYGDKAVEETITAAMAIRWHMHPNPFSDEEFDNDAARRRLIAVEETKLRKIQSKPSLSKNKRERDVRKIKKRIKNLQKKTPPEPIYDLLGYVARHSSTLDPWQRDILRVIRNQSRALGLNARTKLLNEGWASYWHLHIMRRLHDEGLITDEEHGTFNQFHARVTQKSRARFNWYNVGLDFFHYIEDQWNKGKFGREYDECDDFQERREWDTGAGKGREKIFEIRANYSDRMAIEELFSDEFIHDSELYIYQTEKLRDGSIIYYIAEKRPEVIRRILKNRSPGSTLGDETILLVNSDVYNRGELYLRHRYYGLELDPLYARGTLEQLYKLWGSRILLRTVRDGKIVIMSYNGKKHEEKEKSEYKEGQFSFEFEEDD